jgi:predicted acylesterase/phospholipase RssA
MSDTYTENNVMVERKKIKHLVFSGGGPAGLLTYGATKYLAQQGFWSLSDIKSIYGCSIGAYMGVIISLNYAWEWLDDYFIKRPWEKIINISAVSIFEAFDTKGLLGDALIIESLKPLFEAKDLSIDITLEELYAFNKIDIHLYTTNLNTTLMDKVDISHTTHPKMSVIKALCMTTAFPFLFKPICDEGGCYIDGGLLNIYPLNDCIQQQNCIDKEEILAFKNIWSLDDQKIMAESSVVDFFMVLMRKMQKHIDTESAQEDIKNTVRCWVEGLEGVGSWVTALSTEERRSGLIEQGVGEGEKFLKGGTPLPSMGF